MARTRRRPRYNPRIDAATAVASRLVSLREAMTSGQIRFDQVPGACSAKRCLEIAATGGHRCQLVIGTDAPAYSPATHSAVVVEALVAAFSNAFPDVPAPAIVAHADLNQMSWVVAVPDCDVALPPPAEPASEIVARVHDAQARRPPMRQIHPDAQALFEEAKRRIPLTADTAAAIPPVANSIAALANSPVIRRIDIAEALCYFRHTR
ncbi:hypothetical protein [Desulfovibrio sp.]|uniref:hypothetical protein n=1 Tax=Desulfovibrio sp. TaxID=885 RepID=UPI0025C407EA|nr:hypothetical protein [Desulfovibrio sp.]